jgi:nicotinamide mononucleotide transporter
MFLQVFFFFTNLMGWWRWAHPKPDEEDKKNELRVSFMPIKQLMLFTGIGVLGTIIMGSLASNLHEWFPQFFSLPSAFPYLDSFVTVMSIVATFLMIQKKVECWMIWIVVDVVATGLYFAKEIKFVGFEYLIFCFLASFGLWKWFREYKSYATVS